jgi:NAD-dependent SIR2 family protein deacetylase
MNTTEAIDRAAAELSAAQALVIGAGAGMGVDSGLPDFRGDHGFWRAYPRYAELGLNFAALANPHWFEADPHLAWGFYGHRLNLYRTTVPHAGFALLAAWGAAMPGGVSVFTSNVDGQFQRAGYKATHVLEIHGSIHFLQCLRDCGVGILPADPFTVSIDSVSLRAADPLPLCPRCGALLRPNILMFNDYAWNSRRSDEQRQRLELFLEQVLDSGFRLGVIECGAGRAIPSVRHFCATLARRAGVPLIRVNPREHESDFHEPAHIGIALGAEAALKALAARLAGMHDSKGP